MSLLDDPEIKKFQIANRSMEICDRAVDLISKRMESGELRDHMVLRIIATLAKSTAPFEVRRPRRRLP